MEILQNLPKITQPIGVELKFEPDLLIPNSHALFTYPHENTFSLKTRAGGQCTPLGGGVMPAGSSQLLTAEAKEEKVPLAPTRTVGAGCVVGRSQDLWGQSWPRPRSPGETSALLPSSKAAAWKIPQNRSPPCRIIWFRPLLSNGHALTGATHFTVRVEGN